MKTLKLSKSEFIRIVSYILLRYKQKKCACYFDDKTSSRSTYFKNLLKHGFIQIVSTKTFSVEVLQKKKRKQIQRKIIFVNPTDKLLSCRLDTNLVKQ